MRRSAQILVSGTLAGSLFETSKGFEFEYDDVYLRSDGAAVSLTLPKREGSFESTHLHPFFAGLVSEGSTRKIQARVHKIDESDLFGLLLATGRDLVGNVEVVEQ